MDRVERAFIEIDRKFFLPDRAKRDFLRDSPIPIGYDQTTSQPSLIKKMIRILNPDKNSTVLEIGTGCGYQTALLAKLSKKVYTVEIIPELLDYARGKLNSLKLCNIDFKTGDGNLGWAEFSPFDSIIISAGCSSISAALVDQLAANGTLIAPVGTKRLQYLTVLKKINDGKIHKKTLDPVSFVELIGETGWNNGNPE